MFKVKFWPHWLNDEDANEEPGGGPRPSSSSPAWRRFLFTTVVFHINHQASCSRSWGQDWGQIDLMPAELNLHSWNSLCFQEWSVPRWEEKKKTPQNIWYIDYFTTPSTEYTWPYWADIHAPWRGCRDAFKSINDLAPWCQEGHWQPQSLLFHLTHPPTCWHDHHGVQNLQPPSPSEPHRPISACFLLNTVADIYDSKQGGFILRGWWVLLSLFNLSPIKLSG